MKIIARVAARRTSFGNLAFGGGWKQFAEALRNHALEHEVRHRTESDYGTRYVIEGVLYTPDGRNPLVRTVWIVDDDATAPRLVTAYPIESNRMTQ